MPTDADLLTLVHWLSPAFPTGAFSYSHGLEAAVQAEKVTGTDTLRDWVSEVLRFGTGRSDGLFLAAGYRAADARSLRGIDETCRAFAPARERLLETEEQGAAFCATVAEVWRLEISALTYPVAVGRAARLRALPPLATAQVYLHAFLGNLVGAGMRLGLLGQTEGQRVIFDLSPLCIEIARLTRGGDLDDLSGTAFLADIDAMRHETLHSRIFRT
jgi:urease accessory protein